MDQVSVAELVEANNLIVYYGKKFLKERFVTTSDISRPGLELTGYFDYYPEERIQLLGMKEISYVQKKPAARSRRKGVGDAAGARGAGGYGPAAPDSNPADQTRNFPGVIKNVQLPRRLSGRAEIDAWGTDGHLRPGRAHHG